MSRKRGDSHLRTLEALAAELRVRAPKRGAGEPRRVADHRIEALEWALEILWRGYAAGPQPPQRPAAPEPDPPPDDEPR